MMLKYQQVISFGICALQPTSQYSLAKERHDKALKIYKKILSQDHASVATFYDNLALLHKQLGEYNEAKELQEKALVIRKKIFGEDHAEVATSFIIHSKHLPDSDWLKAHA